MEGALNGQLPLIAGSDSADKELDKEMDSIDQETDQLDVAALPPSDTPAAAHNAASSPAQRFDEVALSIGAVPAFVYALGSIEPRFPTLSVEKEFAQATGRADTATLTDPEAARTVLAEPQNRYLARQLCWLFTVSGLETYILAPRDPADVTLLVDAVRPRPSPMDVDLVIGVRGPIAPPETCNGVQVPIVLFDQLYSFDRDTLIEAIPRPESVSAKQQEQFRAAAEEVFDRILSTSGNAGATDEDRARNYLAVRYPAIYATAAEQFMNDASLTAFEVVRSSLSGPRAVVDAVMSFTNRKTGVVEKFVVSVDVTEEFPFLVGKISPYFDR